MRTLAITQNITLDGSVEFLDDWFDPQARGPGDMEDLLEEVQPQSVQGRGRRLFPDGFQAERLRLLDARSFRSGITSARYALD